uniref:CCHC-type domain-containing protein n=1 Tax=Octopus bimaculoides TaxID=37653 RepID=A0A0L8ICC9_OCTBM
MPNSVSSSGEESADGKNIESLLFGDVSDSSEGESPKPTNSTVKSLQTEGKQKRSFASAAGGGTRQLSTNKSNLRMFKDIITIQDGVVKIQPPEDYLLSEKKKTIVYKTYCKKERRIERAIVTEKTYWIGHTVHLLIQEEQAVIEQLPEKIEVGEELFLNVFVEGHKPRCFQCGQIGHIKKYCKEGEEESEGEEEEKDKETEGKKITSKRKIENANQVKQVEQRPTKAAKRNRPQITRKEVEDR